MREKKFLKKLNKTEFLLICFSVFHGITNLFLGTFVVSFLIHNSFNEFISVSVYNLFFYFAIMMTFVLMIGRCKCGNIKKVFGAHLIVQMVLIALLAVLGNDAAKWVVILGMLYGVQHGLYAMSIQQMVVEKVSANRMVFFKGVGTSVVDIVKILIPVTLGALITVSSLQNIAWVMVVMAVIELGILSMFPPFECHSGCCADLIGFIKKSMNVPCMRKMFLGEFLRGSAFILESVGTMYIVYVFHTDMKLGIWTTVFALCTAGATWLFGHFCSKCDFYWIIGVAAGALMLSAMYLIWDVNHFSVLAYMGAFTLGVTMMDQIMSVNTYNLARTDVVSKDYRAEYFAARQVVSFLGRWAGIILLLYMCAFVGYALLPYLIIILITARIFGVVLYAQLSKYTE